MYCENCGNKISKNVIFCRKCGNKINAKNIKSNIKKTKKFNWGLTFLKASFVLTIMFFVISGSFFGFKEEFGLSLFIALFFGLPIGVIATIIISNLKGESNKSVYNYKEYENIPWYRKNSNNSWFILLGWFLFPPLLWITLYSLISGDIYFNKKNKEGNLEKWSKANKIVAWIMFILNLGWLFYLFL
jgi:hypothetical protein